MNHEQRFSLAGKVALVTGSTKGLGRSMALALGQAGARVAINYYNDEATAQAALNTFQEAGCEGMLVKADVTDEGQVNEMVARIKSGLGPVDIAVINATCDQPHHPIEEYSWDFYQKMLDFFIKSPYLITRAILPEMKKKHWGRIINIGSEVFHLGVPNFSAYVAAKGGQNGWSRSMARELAPFGITVNMVSPGWIPVERHDKEPQEWKDAYLPTIPVGRWGVPDDLSGAVTFLASESSEFVTGQNLHVNGGLTLH
ncbi:MAG: SDR family oxidoreductase [Verrucomicrobia bacterium]|jgi:3-oxoacyl-[acyl-carrier protein] reductase|nr:SDR family oxidoreductase [Verrucomicrobiota bacterium]